MAPLATALNVLFLLGWLLPSGLAGTVTSLTATIQTSGVASVIGQNPDKVVFSITAPSALSVAGSDTITITLTGGTAFISDGAAATISTGTLVGSTVAVSTAGTVITITLAGGATLNAGAATVIEVAGGGIGFSTIGAGPYTFSAITSDDASPATATVAPTGQVTSLSAIIKQPSGHTAIIGDVPSAISFTIQAPSALSVGASDTITISLTSGAAFMATGAAATITVGDLAGSTVAVSSSGTVITVTLAGSAVLNANTATSFDVTGGVIVWSAIGSGPYVFSAVTSKDATAATESISPSSLFIGSDPLSVYNGQETKFWIPLEGRTLLLETPELKIYVKALAGPTEDLQWFDSFKITLRSGQPLAHIYVNRSSGLGAWSTRMHSSGIKAQNATSLKKTYFDQLDIRLGQDQVRDERLEASMSFAGAENVKFGWGFRDLYFQQEELFYVQTDSIAFGVIVSPAAEFREDPSMALRFKHLDLIIMEMPGRERFRGLLPELWEVKPRSARTLAMLVPPSESTSAVKNDKDETIQGTVCASM
eukprot:TRINITY_DN7225_c1_g1_i1.p1 TRINITY_DN7225_c1_g1~~TRINITY_DN7225_c1_g1_i1.p1  ORF type:complete len:538 (+),score=91.56 TRINITY_DN7225_c1_g1_i1:57-1670(+)